MKIKSFVSLALLGAAGAACVYVYNKQKNKEIKLMAGDCLHDCLCSEEDFKAKQAEKLENSINDALWQGNNVEVNSHIRITPENCKKVVKDVDVFAKSIVNGIEKYISTAEEIEDWMETPISNDENTDSQEETSEKEADVQ